MKHLQGDLPNQGLNLPGCLDPIRFLSVLFPLEREFLSAECLVWNHPEHF